MSMFSDDAGGKFNPHITSFQDAIEYVEINRPDLIITDLAMPGSGTIEDLLDKILQIQLQLPEYNPRVIVTSGRYDAFQTLKNKYPMIESSIPKPYTFDTILEIFKSAYHTHQIKQESKIKSDKKTILIIDDNPEVQRMLKQQLAKTYGDEVQIELASDEEQANEKLRLFKPTVVLLDLVLQKSIHADSVLQTIESEGMITQVILMSQLDNPLDLFDMSRTYRYPFFVKSLSPDSLTILFDMLDRFLYPDTVLSELIQTAA